MPFYTHKCDSCDYTEEFYLKIADRDSKVGTKCPKCDGSLIRIIEAPGFTDSYSLGRQKAPTDFREMMRAVGKANKGHTMNLD